MKNQLVQKVQRGNSKWIAHIFTVSYNFVNCCYFFIYMHKVLRIRCFLLKLAQISQKVRNDNNLIDFEKTRRFQNYLEFVSAFKIVSNYCAL